MTAVFSPFQPEDVLVDGLESSPARYLYPDVVQEIFLRCLPEDGGLPRPSVHEAPLKLGRICRAWRHIALSSPQLWDSVQVGIPDGQYFKGIQARRSGQDAEALEVWISRSASRPLSISLTYDNYFDAFYFSMALSTIFPHSRRWKRVRIGRLYPELVDMVLATLATGTPMLETFQLETSDHAEIRTTAIDMSSASRLSRFTLDGCTSYFPSFCNTVMHSLRHLSWSVGVISDELLDALQLCPQLETLSLWFVQERAVSRSRDVFTLAHLHTLELTSSLMDTGQLLDRLRLPALKNFSAFMDNHPENLCCLIAMLHRSCAPIVTLSLAGLEMFVAPDDITPCLQLTPRLANLTLEGSMLTDEALLALTRRPETEPWSVDLCPLLSKVMFQTSNPISTRLLAAMIVSRWDSSDISSHADDDTPDNTVLLCDALGPGEHNGAALRPRSLCKVDVRMPLNYGDPEMEVYGYPGIADCVDEGLHLSISAF